MLYFFFFFFFFNDTATTEIYTLSDTLSLHDALPIWPQALATTLAVWRGVRAPALGDARSEEHTSELQSPLNISYAVFCLKKKTNIVQPITRRQRTPPAGRTAR